MPVRLDRSEAIGLFWNAVAKHGMSKMKSGRIAIVALIVALSSQTYSQVNCIPIETTAPHNSIWITAKDITQAGEFCLTHDIRAPRVYVFSEGGERSYNGHMLLISASNIVFDLHAFTMNADASRMEGIRTGQQYKLPYPSHITIRNGLIRSRTLSAIVFGIPNGSLLSDYKAVYEAMPKLAERSYQNDVAKLPQSSDAYFSTENLIEHLKIEAGSVISNKSVSRIGIGIKGGANIIRNNTILVEDPHATIYLFGPNNIIENNIIIFKGKAAVESAAPIKLHQADGTIIRNNDIIIESKHDEGPKAAISLIDSKNVVVENNRIYGIKTLMHAWDDKSNIIDRNNEFRSMLRRPWASGEPGVH
jgi:hypothetical protein